MNTKLLLTLFFFIAFKIASCQKTEYASFLIPDSLTKNSNLVIRNNTIEIRLKSIDKQIIKKHKVITVLNKLGNVNISQHYDKDTKINKLSAKIYDAFGNEIKKYSKSKFTDISAVDGATLYSDARVKYLNYTPTAYPYTIVFESETQNSSTGFIPKWYPIEGYLTAVEKNVFKVFNPKNLTLRTKEKNFAGYPIKNLSKDNVIHYELANQPAKKYEQSSVAYFDILPVLLVASNEFALKGVSGKATNWQEFGKWYYDKLLANQNVLSDGTITKIKELTKNAKTDIEKAKIVYDFVQNKTRYISVQVGIGGWQPIPANEVDKFGYGDCKGLTNYTKALLDAIDVTSYYTVVWAKQRRDMQEGFSSIEGNHIILNIPNKEKDIWLECTSQIQPFGFLGDFTDDRNVLVVTPEGGVIKRTPAYKNEINLQEITATVVLDTKGAVTANVERVSKGIQYDDKLRIAQKSKEELEKYYKSDVWDYNNNLEIKSVKIDNNKDDIAITETVKVTINEYATASDNDYLIRLNIFNKYDYIPKRYRNRTLPLKIDRGFLDIDTYTITIPEGYTTNNLPLKKELTSKFGTYKISLEKTDDTTLIYKKYFLLKEGLHPKEDYKKYRKFMKKIAKLENTRIALNKK